MASWHDKSQGYERYQTRLEQACRRATRKRQGGSGIDPEMSSIMIPCGGEFELGWSLVVKLSHSPDSLCDRC